MCSCDLYLFLYFNSQSLVSSLFMWFSPCRLSYVASAPRLTSVAKFICLRILMGSRYGGETQNMRASRDTSGIVFNEEDEIKQQRENMTRESKSRTALGSCAISKSYKGDSQQENPSEHCNVKECCFQKRSTAKLIH